MSYASITFTYEQGVGRLTLNRPDRLNAFTAEMHAEIAEVLGLMEQASDARVLLITGAGRGFCAGQDLLERKRAPGDPPADLGLSLEERYNPMIRRIAALPVPVVAAVNGVAAGAGANFALACDLVIARASARFIQSFVGIGLVADAGGTWHLPRLVGQARALGLALTGEPIGAEQAADWGLIWRAVPDEAFETEVEALVAKPAAAPTKAVAAAKKAIRAAGSSTLDQSLDLERDLQRQMGATSDFVEGVIAFAEKRPPRFRGA